VKILHHPAFALHNAFAIDQHSGGGQRLGLANVQLGAPALQQHPVLG
jgi:hypothetical protein